MPVVGSMEALHAPFSHLNAVLTITSTLSVSQLGSASDLLASPGFLVAQLRVHMLVSVAPAHL